MEKLYIPATDYTPEIDFDPEAWKFEMSGISRPENVMEVYEPAMDWLDEFGKKVLGRSNVKYTNREITLNFRLTYFNSASTKAILMVLEHFKEFSDEGFKLSINWYYDASDDQMREDAEELSEAVDLPFNYYKE
jgi:hypothetical protein